MCPKGTDEGCVMGCFLEMGQAIWELLEGDVEAMRVSMRKGKGMNCRIIWSKSLSVIPGEIENEKTVFTAHPTNPVECCADANPKTMLPNDT